MRIDISTRACTSLHFAAFTHVEMYVTNIFRLTYSCKCMLLRAVNVTQIDLCASMCTTNVHRCMQQLYVKSKTFVHRCISMYAADVPLYLRSVHTDAFVQIHLDACILVCINACNTSVCGESTPMMVKACILMHITKPHQCIYICRCMLMLAKNKYLFIP